MFVTWSFLARTLNLQFACIDKDSYSEPADLLFSHFYNSHIISRTTLFSFLFSMKFWIKITGRRRRRRRKRWFWWGCWGLRNFQRASEYLSLELWASLALEDVKLQIQILQIQFSLWGWWWWTTTCYWYPFSCNWSGCYSGKRSRRRKLSSNPIADFWSQVSEHLTLDVLCIFSCPCLWTKQRWNYKQKRCNLVFFLLLDWLLAMVSYWSDFQKVLICCMLPLDPLFAGLQICYSNSCKHGGRCGRWNWSGCIMQMVQT